MCQFSDCRCVHVSCIVSQKSCLRYNEKGQSLKRETWGQSASDLTAGLRGGSHLIILCRILTSHRKGWRKQPSLFCGFLQFYLFRSLYSRWNIVFDQFYRKDTCGLAFRNAKSKRIFKVKTCIVNDKESLNSKYRTQIRDPFNSSAMFICRKEMKLHSFSWNRCACRVTVS